MATQPAITVVVPTHNRRNGVERLLHALADQRGAPAFEVVVVDDGSEDDTIVLLQELSRDLPFPLVPVRLERNVGPAAARNVGWRAARAPLVAFTDDDCRPAPQWLGRLAIGLEHADLVQGCTVPDPADASSAGPFSRTVETVREWGFYETCNVGYRKDALARVGGFDEGFRRPFGEDTDLAWRVKDSGGDSFFDAEAVVYHAVWPQSFVGHLRDLPRREGMVRVLSRNPRLRYQLPRRWFWEQSHKPALIAAAGLLVAAAGRSRATTILGAALLVPYVNHRTRVEPLGPAWRHPVLIPQALAADLVEIGVLAMASLRYRTLLL